MKITRSEAMKVVRGAVLALAAGLVLVAPFPTGSQAEHVKWVVLAAAVVLGVVAIIGTGLTPRATSLEPAGSTLGRRLLAASKRIDPVLASIIVLGIWFLIQLVPLPAALVGFLSPERARLAEEISSATGEGRGAWLPLSVCLKCTRDEFLFLAACVAAFYAASRFLRRDGPLRVVMATIAGAGGLMALWGFWRLLSGSGGRLFSTYTSANRLAGLFAISAACSLGLYLMSLSGARRPARPEGESAPPNFLRRPQLSWDLVIATGQRLKKVWLGITVVIALALALTLSRFGIASVLIGALLTLAVFTRRRAFWAGLAGLVVIVALAALLTGDPVLERYSLLFETDSTGSGRAPCWRMALPLAADFPVTGSGGGTFKHAFALYQKPILGGWWKFAHNDYLNLFTDCGVIGFAALVAAAALLMRRLISLRRSGDAVTRAVGFASFLAMATLLVHSLGDYPLRQPANAIALAMLLGIADGRARKRLARNHETVPSPAWRMWTHVVLATGLLLALVPIMIRLHLSAANRAEAEAVSLGKNEMLAREELEKRARLLERSAELDAWDGGVRYEAARTLAALAQGRFKKSTGPLSEDAAVPMLLRAARMLKEARATSPLDPRAYYLAAFLDLSQRRVGSADGLMALAARFGPAWPDVALNSGKYFLLRWVGAARAGGGFGIARWQRPPHAGHPQLFEKLARSMSLAVRAPAFRSAVIGMLLDQSLSSREIDAVLAPDAEINLALARALARRGQHEIACERFVRAFASERFVPTAKAHVAYAASLLQAQKTQAALEHFAKALDASRDDYRAGNSFREIARSLAGIRFPPEHVATLVAFWTKARTQYPNEVEALRGLALAELAAGDGPGGLDHLLEYAKTTGSAAGYADLARAALRLGKPKMAAMFAARAVGIEPRNGAHHFLQAKVMAKLKDTDGTRAALQATLMYGPRHAAAARWLAQLEMRANRHDAAAIVWRSFLRSGGDGAVGHEGLANLCLALEDRSGAREELLKALEVRPNDKRLREKLQGLSE
jgi:tetratricopeptide (TPR) repeat protein